MKKILCMMVAAVMLFSMTAVAYGNTETAAKETETAVGVFENYPNSKCAAWIDTTGKINTILQRLYKQIQQANQGNSQPEQSNQPSQSNQPGQQNPNQAGTSEKPSNTTISGNSQTSQVVSLVNQERSKAGLQSLKTDSQLTKLAQLKAEDMAKNNYFSHTSPTYGSAFDMMKKYGVSYKTAGENIAKGQKTPSAVMTGWMNSQGHRANILSSNYTSIGVGYAADKNGTIYWVQMFKG